jgi:hypothetical protein
MRGLLALAVTVAIGLAGVTNAGAQGVSELERRVTPRPTPVPTLRELLRSVEASGLEDLRLPPALAPRFQHSATSSTRREVQQARLCPMPVARPDTTALERMPVSRPDSTRTALMPVVAGCENPLFR